MEDQIPRDIMDDRLQRLQARINQHRLAFNRSKVGANTAVLVERGGKLPGQMIGRSPWLQSVHLETDAQAGEIVDVTLVAAGPNSVSGAERERGAAGWPAVTSPPSARTMPAAPGSSSNSTNPTCSVPCSAT